MTANALVNNRHRFHPLFSEANETIKVNKLKGSTSYKSKIESQIQGIFLLRHQIGLDNALRRVRVFKLCKRMLADDVR
ncbi:MAG: hypothetical protein ACWA5P_01750 [bacterium]